MMESKHQKGVNELTGNKPVPYGCKKEIIPGMFFAAVAKKKSFVDFCFFLNYFNHYDFEKHAPSLLICLQDKTCFHFKKEEQVNEKELKAILILGTKAWKKTGYLK